MYPEVHIHHIEIAGIAQDPELVADLLNLLDPAGCTEIADRFPVFPPDQPLSGQKKLVAEAGSRILIDFLCRFLWGVLLSLPGLSCPDVHHNVIDTVLAVVRGNEGPDKLQQLMIPVLYAGRVCFPQDIPAGRQIVPDHRV